MKYDEIPLWHFEQLRRIDAICQTYLGVFDWMNTLKHSPCLKSPAKIWAPKLRRWQGQWYQSCDPQSICLGVAALSGIMKPADLVSNQFVISSLFQNTHREMELSNHPCVNWKVLNRHQFEPKTAWNTQWSTHESVKDCRQISRCLKIGVPIDSQMVANLYHRTIYFFAVKINIGIWSTSIQWRPFTGCNWLYMVLKSHLRGRYITNEIVNVCARG